MDNIEKLQYKNLRECLKKYLIEPILGKDYYNMAMDVYGCDKQTVISILRRYYEETNQKKLYKRLFVMSLSLNIILFSIVQILLK